MEYAPQIIHSIVTGTPRTVYGNVPNHGLIDNLPAHGVVEVPCLVDAAGVQPTRAGALPPQLAALNRTYLSINDLVVRAALDEDAPPHPARGHDRPGHGGGARRWSDLGACATKWPRHTPSASSPHSAPSWAAEPWPGRHSRNTAEPSR